MWVDDIEGHEIWKALELARGHLNDAREESEPSPDVKDLLSRIECILDETERRLKATDPYFLSGELLDEFNASLVTLWQNLAQFATTPGDPSTLEIASSHATRLLRGMGQVVSIRTEPDAAALGEAAKTYRRSAGRLVSNLSKEVNQLGESIEEVTAVSKAARDTLDSQKGRVDALVSQTQAQFGDAQAKRLEMLQTFLEKGREQLAEMLGEERTKIEAVLERGKEKQEELNHELRDAKETLESQIGEIAENASRKSEVALAEHNETAKALILDLESKKAEAKEIVGIIANTGMAGAYQTVADSQKKRAHFWDTATMTMLTGFIVLALWSLLSLGPTMSWQALVAKVVAGGGFLLGFGYAAQQSSRHKLAERQNRRYQLELSSLDSYLETLPDDERHKVKAELALTLFGQAEQARPEKSDSESSHPAYKLLGKAIDKLK